MSRLLLDTDALLWWLADDSALSVPARDALADSGNEPLVSAASVWEIAIKRSLGKLTVPDDLPDRIAEEGFSWTLTERLPIITTNAHFIDYSVEVYW